ncbi:MAG: hypothetical protein IPP52_14225 [Ignavibacteria bacterium]|nr:hypothetical protein [Ignavibacteria bacterium]
MTGPVTLTLAGSNSESAPVTGITIGSASLNAALNSVNTVLTYKRRTVTLNAGQAEQALRVLLCRMVS